MQEGETDPDVRGDEIKTMRKKNTGYGTFWDKKKSDTNATMVGLNQLRLESYGDDMRLSSWQNWLEQNRVWRSDHTTKGKRLE